MTQATAGGRKSSGGISKWAEKKVSGLIGLYVKLIVQAVLWIIVISFTLACFKTGFSMDSSTLNEFRKYASSGFNIVSTVFHETGSTSEQVSGGLDDL